MHRWLAGAGFALLVILLLCGLRLLAARIVALHLHGVADRRLALIEHGQPPWHWQLRQRHDIVAGHAFGAADVQAVDGGLRITSRDGTPFEVGLPVHGMLDLEHWPLLSLHGRADAPFRLGVVWRPRLDQPACFGWQDAPVAAGPLQLALDLRLLRWQAADGGGCAAPARIELLRLQLALPAHASLQLDDVAVRSDTPLPAPARPTLQLPSDPAAAIRQLADPALPAIPWIVLPAGASAEAQLALRKLAWLQRPGALILPHGDIPTAVDGTGGRAWLPWAGAIGYLLALAALASRSRRLPPERRWLEAAASLAGPLWLIVGMQIGLRLGVPSLLVFVGAIVFALHAERQRRPADWRWSGGWRAWLMPFAMLPLALLLIAICGDRLAMPPRGHLLMYMSWALLQQWLMLAVVMRRLEGSRMPGAFAVLLTALVFALMHTPNGALMQLCLLAELWWAWCFQRSRTLLPVAAAHAACALLVEAGLVGGMLRSLEVSARFFL
ncbi:CPBP family intramembrane glutamic endopeptidase [Rhodanobacter sp. DHB23]|uniref:CPBP family intramembrane glutamic endopeptidase n=1 Tax=Rhodanobacter sp. DHB23 TaxID=2775923 RepID=UPI001783915F|nr:CPBP family intramembrane glutamic endopeptidase [Rhodanobacter sp. DHB23]MBD8873580.1 CPBP family intramembrane metalloprotease [Rhodanobacter sp. DHB23]